MPNFLYYVTSRSNPNSGYVPANLRIYVADLRLSIPKLLWIQGNREKNIVELLVMKYFYEVLSSMILKSSCWFVVMNYKSKNIQSKIWHVFIFQ